MPLYVLILVDLAVVYFFFGNQLNRLCHSPSGRLRYRLKEYEKHLKGIWLRDRDILPESQVTCLCEAIAELHEARTGDSMDEVNRCLRKYGHEQVKGLPAVPRGAGAWIGEHLEILVVALGVAFGIRSLFIQPFKIPTGSMQPTLYGIHFVATDEAPSASKLNRFFSYWNFSRSAVDVVAREGGRLDWRTLRPSPGNKPFLPESEFRIGSERFTFPGTVEQTKSMLFDYQTRKAQRGPLQLRAGALLVEYKDYEGEIHADYVMEDGELDWSSMSTMEDQDGRIFTSLRIGSHNYDFALPGEDVKRMIIYNHLDPFQGDGFDFAPGEVVIRGYAESGDHLFVNRLGLLFREPRRGDPMVFMTAGLTSTDGRSFGGSYYVKRLVGLPGDTLKICDRKLYVKARGESSFTLLDASVHPGFGKMYSMKGDYRGYAHMVTNPQLGIRRAEAAYLHSNEETFEVPEGQYFMMGDNSENSWDSRWFGCVPRKNLVGPPGFIWWPLSRRWGVPDRCEPDPSLGDSPGNMPVVKKTYSHLRKD